MFIPDTHAQILFIRAATNKYHLKLIGFLWNNLATTTELCGRYGAGHLKLVLRSISGTVMVYLV